MNNFDFVGGEVLLIDKPKGWTSFDVIRKLQGATKYRKFGHAGTLDPLATGLLIICSGHKTKTIESYQGMFKEYKVEFYLGGETDTYDSEAIPKNYKNPINLTHSQIQEVVDENFEGKIQQTPPIYSAIKVNGKRAYKAAREGKTIELKSREVEIYKFQVESSLTNEKVVFSNSQEQSLVLCQATIQCSKGTYIRSLVHDLGQIIGLGGYIKELRRTAIGEYSVKDAHTLEEILNTISSSPKQDSSESV